MERPTAAVPEGDPMASAPSDPRVPADPNEPVDDSPTNSLSLASLLRLSVYWLGLVAVFSGIGVILQERAKVLIPDESMRFTTRRPRPAVRRHRRRPRPADGRLDQ